MDDYMMKNSKTAEKKLEEDMDAYWAEKKKKDAEKGEGGGEDAAAAEEAS